LVRLIPIQVESSRGELPYDALRIRHFIAALSASNAHQKMVAKGPEKGMGKRAGKTEVKEASTSSGLASQRREVQKRKNKQAVVDIMMLLDTNHLSDIRSIPLAQPSNPP